MENMYLKYENIDFLSFVEYNSLYKIPRSNKMKIPAILKCVYLKTDMVTTQNKRMVKDYEIDYNIDSHRQITIDDIVYEIEPNTLIFKKPGQIVSGYGLLDCYMLTLSLSDTVNKNKEEYRRNAPGKAQQKLDYDLFYALPPVFMPKHQEEYENLFKNLCVYKSDNKMMELLHLIASDAHHFATETSKTDNTLSSICKFMKTNYQNSITLEQLAERAHLDKSYFIRKFKKTFGVTPQKYLYDIRMSNAKMLLFNTSFSVKEIASLCGFNDAAYFSSCFKKDYKTSPLLYRKTKQTGLL
jgi:AraC-like DNA-binding protein